MGIVGEYGRSSAGRDFSGVVVILEGAIELFIVLEG